MKFDNSGSPNRSPRHAGAGATQATRVTLEAERNTHRAEEVVNTQRTTRIIVSSLIRLIIYIYLISNIFM